MQEGQTVGCHLFKTRLHYGRTKNAFLPSRMRGQVIHGRTNTLLPISEGMFCLILNNNKWYEVKRLPLNEKLLSLKLLLSAIQAVCFSKCVFMPFFSANAYIYSHENLTLKTVPSIAMKQNNYSDQIRCQIEANICLHSLEASTIIKGLLFLNQSLL